jgi:hypothetical protein
VAVPRERVTKANADRIIVGMSKDSVEDILGPPHCEPGQEPIGPAGVEHQSHVWTSRYLVIYVRFNDNRVSRAVSYPVWNWSVYEETFFERLGRRLGLR